MLLNSDRGEKIYADMDRSGFMKALRKGAMQMVCRICGQFHPKNCPHVYEYESAIDDDLVCLICYQPLVNPLDTRCGCSYCALCLETYVKKHKCCPVDKTRLEFKQCTRPSLLLRRILDKLQVFCPNSEYCDEVLPRNQLEYHLLTKCRGSIINCPNIHLGCDFEGPRGILHHHLEECPFSNYISDMLKEPIIPGKLCQIEIYRGYTDLGLYLVGGCDTALEETVIQRVKPGSIADLDGRLKVGDHIIKLNGIDLSLNTHKEVIDLFAKSTPVCKMTIYRETLSECEETDSSGQEEILKVNLDKQHKSQLIGIKLGHRKRRTKGVYILNILKGSLVDEDGRLKIYDRILEINSKSVKNGTKEDALKIIATSQSIVSFLVSRKVPKNNAIMSEYYSLVKTNKLKTCQPSVWQEFNLGLLKEKQEPLGIVLEGGGGVGTCDEENVPLFVSYVEPKSYMDKTNHIRKGDLIIKINEESLIGISSQQAGHIIESTYMSDMLSISYVRCPDVSISGGSHNDDDEFFRPTWSYFISIPIMYQKDKCVQVCKDRNELLGITIVGGRETSFERVFIKAIIPNSSVDKNKSLRPGDMIVSVDGFCMSSVTHQEAVEFLKSLSGVIRFNIISCPGSLV